MSPACRYQGSSLIEAVRLGLRRAGIEKGGKAGGLTGVFLVQLLCCHSRAVQEGTHAITTAILPPVCRYYGSNVTETVRLDNEEREWEQNVQFILQPFVLNTRNYNQNLY